MALLHPSQIVLHGTGLADSGFFYYVWEDAGRILLTSSDGLPRASVAAQAAKDTVIKCALTMADTQREAARIAGVNEGTLASRIQALGLALNR